MAKTMNLGSSSSPVDVNVASGTLTVGSAATSTLDVNGKIILDSTTYGTSLPSTGVVGQIFFKKV